MKKYDHVTEGTIVQTLEGYLLLTGYNGSIVYCDEYLYNPITEECDIFAGDRMLTASEIAREMKRIDGLNHNVVWQNPPEELSEA